MLESGDIWLLSLDSGGNVQDFGQNGRILAI
jgi:hypothetical protein